MTSQPPDSGLSLGDQELEAFVAMPTQEDKRIKLK